MLRRSLFKCVLAPLFAAVFSLPAAAEGFTEGTHYRKLPNDLPDAKGKLVKIFSYDCPFCFRYDTAVDPKAVPAVEQRFGLKFEPRSLEQKGAYGRAASEFFAMCILADRKAGVSLEAPQSLFRKAKDAAYTAYHRKNERWSAGEAAFVKTLCEATGIPEAEFAKARASAPVRSLADSWRACYEAAKLQGIPAYVVNGRYLVMTREIRSVEGFIELVGALSKL